MRTYYLRLTQADFAASGEGLLSPVIDLYENSTYANYSVTKSNYGLSGLETTWIGMQIEDAVTWGDWRDITWEDVAAQNWTGSFRTDTGRVLVGRYIDHSARADIVSYNVFGVSSLNLMVAVSNESNAVYPEEWETVGPFRTIDEIGIVDADRYVRFFIPTVPASDFELLVRVEIDVPVMAPMYRSMRPVLDKFPEWMAMRELGNTSEAPEVRTPQSLGGMYLNAVAGEWLDHIQGELTYLDFQKYISTVDLDQMAWAYRSTPPDNIVWSIEGDGIPLARAADFYEFTQALGPDDHAAYWDFENNAVYTVEEFTELRINGMVVNQEPHHVWNFLDEIGLIVDLRRLYLESNATFQARILDVFRNRGGVGVLNVKNAIRRELNLWKYENPSIEPDSDYDGARPEILEMSEIEKDPKYVNPDGTPTDAFVELVEKLSRAHPTTWGRFVWDRAVWDPAGENYAGYQTLPYRMDGTPLSDANVQSGVGDNNDLFVYPPNVVTGPKEFEGRLKIRGRQKTERTEYPGVTFDFSIYGQGTRPVYNNPEKAVWFTAEITTTDVGNPTYVHPFEMRSTSNVDVDRAEPSEDTFDLYELFDHDGVNTNREVSFNDPTTNEPYNGTGQIPVANIQSLVLRQGRWEAGSYGFLDVSNEWEAWFSIDPATVLDAGTASITVDPATLSPVLMKSLAVATPTDEPWFSDKQAYRLTLNGEAPFTAPVPREVLIPEIVWASNVSNQQIRIELETLEEGIGYGARTTSEDGTGVFLTSNYLQVDGNATWTIDAATYKLLPTATTAVTFSTAVGANYPMTFTVWELFENEQTATFSGVVDENGPWRNNTPPREGNTNFTLRTASVSRTDFGLPHTIDYVVTWMGVEVVDEPRVLVWLDSNTVAPAVPDASEVEYPPSAIQEIDDAGTYYFEPFLIHARLRPNPKPEWYPHIHSGYFYDRNDEYYMFAKERTATATVATEVLLDEPVRQGAPVIVTGVAADESQFEMRRVAFFDPDADTIALTLTNTERVKGTGIASLFLAYSDVYNVIITDVETGDLVAADGATATNAITTTAVTDRDREYDVTYRVRRSFYVDNDYVDSVDGQVKSRVVFDALPTEYGGVRYDIAYEASDYDPAREIDLPLNPLYSVQHEGFIFISHNEYTLDSVRVHMSPNKLVADGEDYMLISLFSMDRWGNPKPNQIFNIATTFGTVDNATVTTDHDGFAVVILTAADSTATVSGTLTISGGVDATVNFEIEPESVRRPRLLAIPQAEQIRADGTSLNIIYGRVEDADFEPPGPERFEDFAGGITGWTGSSGTIAHNTVEGRGASGSLELTATGGTSQAYTRPTGAPEPVTAGEDYTASLWVKAPVSRWVNIVIDWRDVNGIWISSSSTGVELTADTWTFLEITGTAPANATTAVWGPSLINTPEAGALLYLDDVTFRSVASYTVTWKRGRNLYDLFGGTPESTGTVTINDEGEFVIGPFVSAGPDESGYWFVSAEATVGDVTTGDVVFWHEYPTSTFGVENFEGLPPQPINADFDQVPAWTYDIAFPANYDESVPWADPNPVTVEWLPPTWYAIQKYVQYQLGLLGNQRGTIDYGYYVNRHQWLKSL